MNYTKFKSTLILLMTYLLIQIIARFVMVLIAPDLSVSLLELASIFIFGLIYDLTVWGVIGLGLILLMLIGRPKLINAGIFIYDFSTIIIAVAQILFFREFGTNFNFIAVDYLIYTHELLGNIWQSFNVPLILILIILIALLIYNLQQKYLTYEISPLIIIVSLTLMPIVQSSWRDSISDNRYNVEIAANGAYEFVRAYFQNELDYDTFYLTKENIDIESERYVDNSNEMSNIRPNVIIITVESLSADYLSMFGGSDNLTPNLDDLANKSYIFTQMYATGTRTVRGLEALTLCLPPTPGQSIIRRENNDNLIGLGDVFRENGYVCDFIYGGYGYFDNMNAFFEGNGYNVKDRTSIPDDETIHETIWGVADEVLFTQVLKSMDEHFNRGEHAFEMVMTTSNHRPFTFPEGRVDMPDGTRNAAVKYTDWAIADFLKRASEKAWFDNTIFVIIADHQALAAGKAELPINRYHIPCFIYAPKLIAPGKCERLISQIDIGPTLLGMIGISYNSRFIGRDVNRVANGEERAFISTYQLLGFVKNDTLIVLMPDKSAKAYHINDWSSADYLDISVDSSLVDEAVNYYQGAAYLFKSGQLKLNSR